MSGSCATRWCCRAIRWWWVSIPIILALSLNQLRDGFFKRSVWMISYAPYFISTVVMAGLILHLDLRRGPVNLGCKRWGSTPSTSWAWPITSLDLCLSGIWQNTGFNTIIFPGGSFPPSTHRYTKPHCGRR
ncbi:MAG: hypothetical protein R2856_33110 [Caldilineaceae bacterium]